MFVGWGGVAAFAHYKAHAHPAELPTAPVATGSIPGPESRRRPGDYLPVPVLPTFMNGIGALP